MSSGGCQGVPARAVGGAGGYLLGQRVVVRVVVALRLQLLQPLVLRALDLQLLQLGAAAGGARHAAAAY